jgi:hypothetical protein
MTTAEALGIVDKVCADFRGTRADHQQILQAVQLIQHALNPPVPPAVAPVPSVKLRPKA